MSANGISDLPTKEERQKAKLNLAAEKRAANGNPRSTYDITQLPTQYDGNDIIDNQNAGGLVQGRPWFDGAGASLYNSGLWFRTYPGYFNDDPLFFVGADGDFGFADAFLGGGSNIPEYTSVEWQGYFLAETTGTYTFTLTSDDASYLWIGESAINPITTVDALVKNGGLHGLQEASGSIELTAGVYYPIRIQAGNNQVSGACFVRVEELTPTQLADQLFYKEIILGI